MSDYTEQYIDLSIKNRKLHPAVNLPPFAAVSDAIGGEYACESELRDGWRMLAADAADAALADFYKPGFKDGAFSPVSVPQNLFLDEVLSLYDSGPADAPKNPALYYRCWFELAEYRRENNYTLSFWGAEPCAELYVNGIAVGAIADGFIVSDFLLNGLLRAGKNLVAIKLSSGGGLCASWDERVLFGLYRRVSLRINNSSRIVDLYVKSAPASSGGRVECDVSFICGSERVAELGGSLSVSIYNGELELAHQTSPFSNKSTGRLNAMRFSATLESARLWSPDSPFLYRAVAELKDAEGRLLDVRGCNFGINSVGEKKLAQNGAETACFTVNGEPIKLRGAEYYAYGGPGGYLRPAADIRFELSILKENGFNAVRLIAPDEQLLEFCDALGLFVVCECPLALAKLQRSHRGANDPLRFGLERMATMVSVFKNHPSVIMWSLGDCPGYARATLQNTAKSIDKTRPLVCDGDYSFAISDLFAAVDCSLEDLENIAAGRPVFRAGILPTTGYRSLPFLLLGYALAGEKTPGVAARYAVINGSARLSGGFCERLDWGDTAGFAHFKADFAAQKPQPAKPEPKPAETAAQKSKHKTPATPVGKKESL